MGWWDWVILVAGVVSALGVMLHEVRRFRDRPRVRWGARVIDLLGLRVEVRNVGDVPVTSVIVSMYECVAERGGTKRDLGKLAVDEIKEVRMQSVEGTAWLMIFCANPANQRRLSVTWTPLGSDQNLRDEHMRQHMRGFVRTSAARLRYGIVVGPGTQLHSGLPRDARGLAMSLRRLEDRHTKLAKRAERKKRRKIKDSDHLAS